MEIIKNKQINETLYIEVLENGLKICIAPKETKKKYIIWGTNFGSNNNKFYAKNETTLSTVPDGIAHYLEHKLFEQKNGKNSLDVLTSLGADANAYTTNDHTAFLFETTKNFEEALDEFMDYVQNPYFTPENVEKERGIISQEIMMYDDYPDWKLYMNLMKSLYKKNEMNIDTAGSVESIKAIDEKLLYKIYDNFYTPENMVICYVGNDDPNEILSKIKSRIILRKSSSFARKYYNEEPKELARNYIEDNKNLSIPLICIGFKDNNYSKDIVKRDVAIDIIGNSIFGPCSDFYKRLYESGKITSDPYISHEFGASYGHVMIQTQTRYVDDFSVEVKKELEKYKSKKISDRNFERALKCEYGILVKSYNDPQSLGNMILTENIKNIKPFEYFDVFKTIDLDYVQQILTEIFDEKYMAISIVK